MKKLIVWALMLTFVVAGSAFAQTVDTGAPATIDNDDSCDISVAPAATLLLPYFEVDLGAQGAGETTLWTITNTSRLPQIAHVTIWTDWSYPVLDFNIFLTGYDVQSINMYDIVGRQQIAPAEGTSSDSDEGELSALNTANPLLNLARCDDLPVRIPDFQYSNLRSALTTGLASGLCGSTRIGTNHGADTAIGYVTVDVSSACSTSLPIDPGYFGGEVLFDNVLIGDYQQVDSANNFAQGNPMVHIRAIPEGGPATATATVTNLPNTFYGRYQAGGTLDRRQPLPSVFAARWIEGGTGDFQTSYKIWREGVTGATATCAQYVNNSELTITEIVRFDEHENPTTFSGDVVISPPQESEITFPETSLTSVSASNFPENDSTDVGGWMYLNLDNTELDYASQNWVVVSMRAEGRYSVDFDAAWLGNGCSPNPGLSDEATNPIGPLDNVNLLPLN